MTDRKVIVGIALAVALAFTGCSLPFSGQNTDDKAKKQDINMVKKPPTKEKQQPTQKADPVKEQLDKMTLQEKIGQMVIVGIDGYSMNEKIRTMLDTYHVGGFILFGDNVKSPAQLLSLINSLKSSNSKNRVPLFISVDEEGGRVSRMPEELTDIPDSKTIGEAENSSVAFDIGRTLAQEIKAFGFNMNFAPVLDINSNLKNPVIGNRSFGSDAEVVSDMGIQTMKGMQIEGIIPVVKHFPGHGDTAVDSHVGLPFVNNDLSRLESFELIPFKEAISSRADAVMIAHILLNKIDAQNPASLSKTIITDLLRRQLGFDGIVITDDMTMGAIAENYKISSAAVKSVNAGSDIVLVCHGYENEIDVINVLIDAVENGTIPLERVNQSVYRILKLKLKYNLTDNAISSVNVDQINSRINAVLNSIY